MLGSRLSLSKLNQRMAGARAYVAGGDWGGKASAGGAAPCGCRSLSPIVLQSPSCHPRSTKEETKARAGRRMDWPRASQRVNLGLQTPQPHAALTLTLGLLGGGHVDSLTVPGSETKQEPQPASVLLKQSSQAQEGQELPHP